MDSFIRFLYIGNRGEKNSGRGAIVKFKIKN